MLYKINKGIHKLWASTWFIDTYMH